VTKIESILFQLVGVQSDTGTALECDMARRIHAMICSDPYFSNHLDQVGTYNTNDILGRPVVWALRSGKSAKTIILMGHYDTVEIDSYGPLKPYALDPAALKREMKAAANFSDAVMADLDSEDWVFGRGTADMKAGLAINMYTLFTNTNENINILFIAVPDEENISSGALMSVPLYHELQQRFDLEYKLCIISEPQFRTEEEDIQLIEGSTGKILPIIVAKGVLAHSAESLKGLNAGYILAEIIRHLELSTDLVSEDMGIFTQPPTLLFFKDLKETYDVSIPEYGVAGFNILFLKSMTPALIIESIKTTCEKSLDVVVKKYAEAFEVLRKKGFVHEADRKNYVCKVVTLAELEADLEAALPDFHRQRQRINSMLEKEVLAHKITLQSASSQYIRALIEISAIRHPLVVIGISPPYYPPVNNTLIGKEIEDCLVGLSEQLQASVGKGVKRQAYLSFMTDMSYMACIDPLGERAFLQNLTLPPSLYEIPVEAIAELNIPSMMIGPMGRDVHLAAERVFMPDVRVRIPALFELIINKL
jgi:arginine utilization protein RocB